MSNPRLIVEPCLSNNSDLQVNSIRLNLSRNSKIIQRLVLTQLNILCQNSHLDLLVVNFALGVVLKVVVRHADGEVGRFFRPVRAVTLDLLETERFEGQSAETDRILSMDIQVVTGRSVDVLVRLNGLNRQVEVLNDNLVQITSCLQEDSSEHVELPDKGADSLGEGLGICIAGEVDIERHKTSGLAGRRIEEEGLLHLRGRVEILDGAVAGVQLRPNLGLDKVLRIFQIEELECSVISHLDIVARLLVALGMRRLQLLRQLEKHRMVEDILDCDSALLVLSFSNRVLYSESLTDDDCQIGKNGAVENILHSNPHMETVLDARNELRSEERVTTELEEMIADFYLHSKDLSCLLTQRDLDIRDREVRHRRRSLLLRQCSCSTRKLFSVDLAIGVERHRVQYHDVGRNHVRRDQGLELLAHLQSGTTALQLLERAVGEGCTIECTLGVILAILIERLNDTTFKGSVGVGDVANRHTHSILGEAQVVKKSRLVHLLRLKVNPAILLNMIHRFVRFIPQMHNSRVAIGAEFVGGLHVLGDDLNMLDNIWTSLLQSGEEGRLNEKLFLSILQLLDLLAHPILGGVVIGAEREDALDAGDGNEAIDDLGEILGCGEVLNNGVEDHEIGVYFAEFVDTNVAVEARVEVEQDHTTTGTDLEDIARDLAVMQGVNSIVQPLLHLTLVDILTIVHRRPALEIVSNGRLVHGGADIRVHTTLEMILPALDLVACLFLLGGIILVVRDDESDHLEWPVIFSAPTDDNGGVKDILEAEHGRLDFPCFDTITADLELVVHAAEELKKTVAYSCTHSVTGTVSLECLALDGDVDEAVLVELGVSVASTNTVSSNNKLSHDAKADKLLVGIHDVGTRVVDTSTNGNTIGVSLILGDVIARADYSSLSRTVDIGNLASHKRHGLHGFLGIEPLTSNNKEVKILQSLARINEVKLEHRRREEGGVDALFGEHSSELFAVQGGQVVDADDRSAVQEHPVDLPDGSIEGRIEDI
ncbi:hypothetical protein HG530_011855 [Fusarium avenaceum]|nr:hypothetical protein HG530_011855 [Fusarium avenaceum]